MKVKSLLYISTLPKDSQTGGANAVNFHTYRQLERYFNCTYVQINPPIYVFEKWLSQIKRKVFRGKGNFFFYSKKRLNIIKKQFEALEGDYDLVFFRGFTPWIHCQPKQTYVAFNDVNFQQFFENTFSYKDFSTRDINRIFETERQWLSHAQKVCFESRWGAKQCSVQYNISEEALIGIGRGGNIPLPSEDTYKNNLNLLLVANNFYQKGGDIVFDAFKNLIADYPNLRLQIVGGDPGEEVKHDPNVDYYGRLDKSNTKDLEQLTSLFSKAFLLMHPTREDTNPLVITEAGYFGCPVISVEHFAIPELIINNKTGVLLSYLPSSSQVFSAIKNLIENKQQYMQMRKDALCYNQTEFSWDKIGLNLKSTINAVLSKS